VNSQTIFDKFNDLNVLIIGDVMLDRYLTGKVDRVSPEAPVPVVRLQGSENRLGGAANVALNIKAMGATPFLCSVIGEDENARIFMDLLPNEGLNSDGIIHSPNRCTTVKTRVIAANQHLLRVDQEDTFELSVAENKKLFSNLLNILDNNDIHVILFQDYNKGVLSKDMIKQTLLESERREIPTVVDPKLHNFFEFGEVSLFKPNLKETKDALPFAVDSSTESLTKASNYLRSKMGHKHTMITLSEKGIFIDDALTQSILPTQARNIADVCGAGDTVISIAALGLALQLNLTDIAILANLAGGQVCEKVGVVPVHKTQLQEEYEYLLAHSKT
jgi:D-glycero-beta-D-manno-heptose-7-phosphate kinase